MPAKMVAKARTPKPDKFVKRPELSDRDRHSSSGEASDGASKATLAPVGKMVGAQIRFKDADKCSLRDAGVTDLQIFWLERGLPEIQYLLAKRPTNNDVRDKVEKLRGILKKAESEIRKMADASRSQTRDLAARAAFNYLCLAVWTVDEERALDGIDMAEGAAPVRLSVEALIRLALAVCEKAMESEVPRGQGVRHSATPAVKEIVQALRRPNDLPPRKSAARLIPSTGGSALLPICELVFDLFGARGRADYAVKQYRKEFPNG